MKTLAFDTSTKILTIALSDDDNIVASFHEDVGIRHSEILAPTIKDLLDSAGWKMKDIRLVSVGMGPGSFTGLRIAAATVKGIASGMPIKISAVPTMDAIAEGVAQSFDVGASVSPLLDARKGKVYACVYDVNGGKVNRKTDELLVTIDDLMDSLKEETVFFGDAIEKYKEVLDSCKFAKYDENVDWYPNASIVARIGVERQEELAVTAEDLEPLYLHSKECNITTR